MRTALLAGLTACASPGAPPVVPQPFVLPDALAIHDALTGRAISADDLLQRLIGADLVLLGELHDNAAHHRIRGALIAASTTRAIAVVFEQFAAAPTPIPPPARDQSLEAWLDAHGFDRIGWRWPLHQPVVTAARDHGRAIWGSGVSREALRAVVRSGVTAAPEDLTRLIRQAPLDARAQTALDHALVEGHCGQLPDAMIPGMRAAQEVRDAAMTRALLAAGAGGPAWLIAGNGHVRKDMAVPRLLRTAAPGRSLVVVGLAEAGERVEGGERYDIVVVTSPAERGDPCAAFRR